MLNSAQHTDDTIKNFTTPGKHEEVVKQKNQELEMRNSQFWQLKSPITQLSLESDSDDSYDKDCVGENHNEPKYSKSPSPITTKIKEG